jgi:hypothetical protein
MRRHGCRILAVALALAGGCAHTKATDDGTSKEPAQEEAKEKEKETKPSAAAEKHAKQGGELHPGKRDNVPVTTTPGGLLAPGAEDKIRERLVEGGYLPQGGKSSEAGLREGLKRFQRAKDLPETGVPDHETVKRLGLDPGQTFHQGAVKD